MNLNVNEFRLRDTVQAAVNLLASGARDKNIELACNIDEAVPESLLGDDMRLRQVLLRPDQATGIKLHRLRTS